MCVMLYSTAPNSTAPNSTAPSAAEESATSSAQSEGPVVSLALVPHRYLRRDTRADEPAEELARPVRRVGREPVGLQTQRLFGALDHGLGRSHFVVGAGRSGLHIDDYRVRDVDQVIEPVAERACWLSRSKRSTGPPARSPSAACDRRWDLRHRGPRGTRRPPVSGVPAPTSGSRLEPCHDNDWRQLQ